MKPACSHVQVQIQNGSIHKHWAHLLRCLAWHSSCGMAFDRLGSPTIAHVSSDSTGQGTCFHSLQLILSLTEMEKKTIVVSLCILSSLLPHWLTQHNSSLWAFNFYVQAWFLLDHHQTCIFHAKSYLYVFKFRTCKMYFTFLHIFPALPKNCHLLRHGPLPPMSLTFSAQVLTMVSL